MWGSHQPTPGGHDSTSAALNRLFPIAPSQDYGSQNATEREKRGRLLEAAGKCSAVGAPRAGRDAVSRQRRDGLSAQPRKGRGLEGGGRSQWWDAAAPPADSPMVPSSLPALGRALRWPAFSAGRAALSGSAVEKPVESGIRAKLQAALEPLHLEVLNDSHLHAVPRGSETHFRVVVASRRFEGLSLIHRHRLVNELLQEELAGPVHSLSIQAKTPQQWEKSSKASQSPPCLGGAKHDPHVADKLGKTTGRVEAGPGGQREP